MIFDVGGTLWPDRWPSPEIDDELRARQLEQVLPDVPPSVPPALVAALNRADAVASQSERQQSNAMLRECLRAVGIEPTPAIETAATRAMLVPALGRVELFVGVVDVLEWLHGITTVAALSNSTWRAEADYVADFRSLGAHGLFDVVVSSVDIGWRKPHPRPFLEILTRLDLPPTSCAFIGNSERNDIIPAQQLGMYTVLTAVEEPLRPTAAAAVTEIGQLIDVLEPWLAVR